MIVINIQPGTDRKLADTIRSFAAQTNQELALLKNEMIKLRAENKALKDRLNKLEYAIS